MSGFTGFDIARHAGRSMAGAEHPATLAEVRQVVRKAAQNGLQLYPISGGRNWGAGSRQPVSDGCLVVDLGRLNGIRRLDLERGYAVIEAGVTQRQLAQALAGSDWLANFTPSCAGSSVVGNALERGDGMLRSRVRDVLGLEVVMPSGEVVSTGGLSLSGDYAGLPAGPDMTQAFVQSNFGIVTAMAISLVWRPSVMRFLHARISDAGFVDALEVAVRFTRTVPGSLGLTRLFGLVMTPREQTTKPLRVSTGFFNLVKPVLGTENDTHHVTNHFTRELASVGGVESVRSPEVGRLPADDPLYQVARVLRGEPNCDTVAGEFGRPCAELDAGPLGWMVFLPLVPLDTRSPAVALELLRTLVDRYRVQIAVELNLVSQHAANAVVQIYFYPDDDGRERAHRFRRAVREAFIAAGFYPYRSNIDDSPFEIAARDDAQLATLRAIKALVDPLTIIAPCRYIS
jgi:4-cresol dehydrogenase (hydroxylating) flavoprotein subunit